MLSFLREAPTADGKPGPLSMRRIAAAACVLSSIASGILAIVTIYRFIERNPGATLDWKLFIPLFIPCVAFLVGSLLLMFFTTWGDIKELMAGVAQLKGKGA
jgi:hypothetical protein